MASGSVFVRKISGLNSEKQKKPESFRKLRCPVLSNQSVLESSNRKESYGVPDLSFIQRKTSINRELCIYGVMHNKILSFRYIYIFAKHKTCMNFKFTLWKSIASIVGGIILGYLSEGLLMRSPTCELGATSCPPVTDYSLIFMGGFILLIYLIWSLVQKK